MVNPIATGVSPPSQALIAAEFERSAAFPKAAVIVTPPAQAQDSGAATLGSPGPHASGDQASSLEQALDMVNDNMTAWSTGMRFEVDSEAQRLVVSIIDSKTGEVLRTVPSDAVIRIAKMIVQLQGASIDTKV